MATESLIVEVLGGAAGFMTILFGGFKLIIDSTNKSIHNKIDTFKSTTSESLESTAKDINRIFDTLKIVDNNIAKDGVIESLRSIAISYIYYNKGLSNNAKITIDTECDYVIALTQSIISEKFNQELMDLTSAKLQTYSNRMIRRIEMTYGRHAADQFIDFQDETVDEYRIKLGQLVQDGIVNSKYNRFKSITESFLHNLITGTLHFIYVWEGSYKTDEPDDEKKEKGLFKTFN